MASLIIISLLMSSLSLASPSCGQTFEALRESSETSKTFPIGRITQGKDSSTLVSAVSSAEADAAFKEVSSLDAFVAFREHRDASWRDNCAPRARDMVERLKSRGLTPVSVYIDGRGIEDALKVDIPKPWKGDFVSTDERGKETLEKTLSYEFHVAVALVVTKGPGRTELMVFDPLFFEGPVSVEKWALKLTQRSAPGRKFRVFFGDGSDSSQWYSKPEPQHYLPFDRKDPDRLRARTNKLIKLQD